MGHTSGISLKVSVQFPFKISTSITSHLCCVLPPISGYFHIFQSPQSDMSQGLRFGVEKNLREPTQVRKEAVALNNRNFEIESNK